jgi:hypothetical protein
MTRSDLASAMRTLVSQLYARHPRVLDPAQVLDQSVIEDNAYQD